MTADTFLERVRVGSTDLTVTRLGLGTAALGGWPQAVSVDQAVSTIRRAWDRGVRYFDTAPFYGHGNSESNLGWALGKTPREEFTLSSKVGIALDEGPAPTALYQGAAPFTPRFDFSAAAIRRSLDESRSRLGFPQIDIAFIHDPDDHHDQASREAYPLLRGLRDAGVLKAIGVGMNSSSALARFAEEADFDCFLVAGRYTLLEQHSLDDLLPIAQARGMSIMVGGSLNSGLLVSPGQDSFYNYAPAPQDVIDRAQRIESVCTSFEVPLRAAALQFPLAHPAVTALLAGARTPQEVDDTFDMFEAPIPDELWQRLKEQELLRADAPTPRAGT